MVAPRRFLAFVCAFEVALQSSCIEFSVTSSGSFDSDDPSADADVTVQTVHAAPASSPAGWPRVLKGKRQRVTCPDVRPSLSIVFITKRPGTYDVLLHSLSQQVDKDYELIIIDSLSDDGVSHSRTCGCPACAQMHTLHAVWTRACGQIVPTRKAAVEEMASALGVNLAVMRVDKHKTRAVESRNGLCNAYNSGALEACGNAVPTC